MAPRWWSRFREWLPEVDEPDPRYMLPPRCPHCGEEALADPVLYPGSDTLTAGVYHRPCLDIAESAARR